ncbi:hypothetical protein GI374_05530 [Paracoccus sp. S-4012]|uniref:hypothetical protein n=1 Tax=Paracoccus sp. S-4012 TaxID=2665648 RepID=UPI0012B00618|nr:hypothetical protein [Paracoccus sp. S-4012]MRX49918.1 hypothetical protein [Paracoccus sp. S-4012]
MRVDLPPDAALPLGLDVPAVLLFADFDCGDLCDAILGQTAAVLAQTGLTPGRDFRLVVVGLDPRDSAASAEAFLAAQTDPPLRAAATLLSPNGARLAAMTAALGYGYAWDAVNDRFAHPAAHYVIAADGRVRNVLPAFAASEADLRAAILGAGLGTGPVATRLILFCYDLDPETGRYSLQIRRILMGLGLLTVASLLAGMTLAFRRERRSP